MPEKPAESYCFEFQPISEGLGQDEKSAIQNYVAEMKDQIIQQYLEEQKNALDTQTGQIPSEQVEPVIGASESKDESGASRKSKGRPRKKRVKKA